MAVAVCVVSCFKDGPTYSNSYTADTHFESYASFGSDSLYFENQYGGGIGWQDFAFYHKLNSDKTEFQGGFILSRLKGSGYGNDGFRVNSGVGMGKSDTYAVYYQNPDESKMPEHDIEFLARNYGTCSMIGCYVNNTKEVVESVRNTFKVGDRLAIRMTGYLDEKVTASQEFVLAEYTEAKDSVVTAWSPFKLEKLASVDYVDIEFVTNRDDIPKAFCLDDMMAKISVSY